MPNIYLVEDAYYYALRVEDKLKRKIQGNAREKEKQDSWTQAKLCVDDEFKNVRRIGRGEFRGNCFRCVKEGHISFKCHLAGKILL